MKLNSFSLAGMIFVLMFGGIGLASALGWWQTETQKVPVRYSEGEAAGQYNPADIRGSYTFGDVSELYHIPLADLQTAFRIPADTDPAAYQVKSLEEQFAGQPVEIGTGSVRLFVAFYLGQPFNLAAAEDAYLFKEAAQMIEQQGNLTAEQSAYLNSHTASGEQNEDNQALPEEKVLPDSQPVESTEKPAAADHEPEEYQVTVKTSFQDRFIVFALPTFRRAVLFQPD